MHNSSVTGPKGDAGRKGERGKRTTALSQGRRVMLAGREREVSAQQLCQQLCCCALLCLDRGRGGGMGRFIYFVTLLQWLVF